MSEVWIAALASAAVSVGTTAYTASQQPGFGGAPPIPFNPIDIGGVNQQIEDASKIGYDLADKDLATRLPGLVTANKIAISDNLKELTGPLDPTVQNAFAKKALISSLGATGGGNSAAGVGGVGSFAGNSAASSIANSVQGKQDQDRANLSGLLAANPERSLSLSGGDAANLSIANAQNQNSENLARYQYQTQKDAAGGGGGF